MDDRQSRLKEKLAKLLAEAAEVEVELSRAEGAIVGVPHYSVIESRAHALGRSLSQHIQQRQMSEVAAVEGRRAKCPKCGTVCELGVKKRPMMSIDGELSMADVYGHCPVCRRDFFPSSGGVGI